MANWSQSHFLQSLGWATLNSFWQMALLWCLFSLASFFFRFSSSGRYKGAVLAILVGFAWFVISFINYYQSSSPSSLPLFNQTFGSSGRVLPIFLISASITYLALLVFPSYRLYKNWKFVQLIKKQGLHKADLHFRLFVQKIESQLGIRQKVKVFVSDLVKSPLTIGSLKPVILVPVAALNHLSTQQVEAILLHELSHIRRFDYLVNFMTSIVSTLLYFNPFLKLFLNTMEEERELCCDQLVLQYGYDKVGYASALLTLEKLSVHRPVLALGATGKACLLNRIEKIVGLEKKKGLKFHQLSGMLAALVCILAFNSFLIIKEKKEKGFSIVYDNLANPLDLFTSNPENINASIAPDNRKATVLIASAQTPVTKNQVAPVITTSPEAEQPVAKMESPYPFQQAAADDVDLSLTSDQKDKVEATVNATKKILINLQWNEVEKNIADALNEQEKAKAKQEYLQALNEVVNWKNMEQNLKARYHDLDWSRINNNVKVALNGMLLDSLEKNYTAILSQLDQVKTSANPQVKSCPLPDQSVEQINRSAEEMRQRVEALKSIRHPKKVVRL